MASSPEPAYPLAALDTRPMTDTAGRVREVPTEDAQKVGDAWNDDVLIWGRTGWDQNARVCRWARGLGAKDTAGKPIVCPEPRVASPP